MVNCTAQAAAKLKKDTNKNNDVATCSCVDFLITIPRQTNNECFDLMDSQHGFH